jgi:hypothetical protein
MHGRMSHSTDVHSLIELWNQQSICRRVLHAIQLLILCVAYCVCVCMCVFLQNLVHYVFGRWGSLL